MTNINASPLETAKFNMIEQQIRPCEVNNPRVIDALHRVNRHEFVPPMYQNLAYADCQIPFSDTQHMMKPLIEGKILQALDIQEHESCLEVGTGTGYFTACLSVLAKSVHSIDIDAEQQKRAQKSLTGQFNTISFECANAFDRIGASKQYDIIVVTAAVSTVPDNFKEALNTGGRLFVIEGTTPTMQAKLITRTAAREWSIQALFETEINQLVN